MYKVGDEVFLKGKVVDITKHGCLYVQLDCNKVEMTIIPESVMLSPIKQIKEQIAELGE